MAAIGADSTICNCNNVTKGTICAAIGDGGLTTVGQVKAATKAGTGCGSCTPLCTAILHHELEKAGVTIDRSLCEHFPFTRQQLFDIVRVRQLRSFEELISGWGKGRGCEICRPAVGSMLASLWNEYVLDPAHAGLQDTNDRFLANMQKDGSYSIVPRVPGGEITPEKLIALGEVGREFNLYTKITGAQRIDLFGARLDQLPQIWRRLIDAGFESGHAYGKALRTVKSCVGSTWCRFGVQDSVALAIEIELRYRGFRAPHKLKSAVSGCARECAEAQGKDFGVIATETGWNVYVCGNGGMRPQHAVLLAESIDRDTVIKYLDRFLMFYTRTADRLERTAPWFNKLEGGHRLPEVRDHRRRPRHLRRARSRDAALRRHVRVRMEGDDRGPGEDRPLHPLRERRRDRRRQPRLHAGAGPEAPGPAGGAGVSGLGPDLRLRGHLSRHRVSAHWSTARQVAVFRLSDGTLHAISNHDPFSGANVLSRGIVGDRAGEPKVASPIYKQTFNLRTGVCYEDAGVRLDVYRVRRRSGMVEIFSVPADADRAGPR